MLRSVFFATVLTLMATPARGQAAAHNYIPPAGYVPDSATAMRIPEAVWLPIFGEKQIAQERPFVATLKDGVWTVVGSLPTPPPGFAVKGGVAEIEISKQDGRVLRVSHGK
jgi:hypothetical protein